MRVLKLKPEKHKGGTICDRFWSFLKWRSPLIGWKHPRAQMFKGKSLKKKEIEEKEMGLSLKIIYSHHLPLFLFILMVFFHLLMF